MWNLEQSVWQTHNTPFDRSPVNPIAIRTSRKFLEDRRILAYAGYCAPAFHQDHISPAPVHAPEFLARADDSEAVAFMRFDAGQILREDSCLQGPEPLAFGLGYQRVEQTRANFSAARPFRNVHTHLSHTRINTPARDRTQRCPAQDFRIEARHKPAGL